MPGSTPALGIQFGRAKSSRPRARPSASGEYAPQPIERPSLPRSVRCQFLFELACRCILVSIWTFVIGLPGWYKDPVLLNLFFLVILLQIGVIT
jgi:hypothetical protein